MISPSQRPLPTQQTQQTNIRAFSENRTRDPSSQTVSDLRLRPAQPPRSAVKYICTDYCYNMLSTEGVRRGGGCWSLTLRTFLTSTTAKFPAYDVFPCHTHEHHYKLKYPSLDLAIRANFFESLNKYLPC